MNHSWIVIALVFVAAQSLRVLAQNGPPPDSADAYLAFIKHEATALRAEDKIPTDLIDREKQSAALRSRLLQAWGGFPAHPAPLNPRIPGGFQRDGYRVEKILFQTLPGIWMTANAYVPNTTGKHPAILMVHGHWPGAKQDPVVQSRCIGAAKLGFFVLAVDAFGAGERAVGKKLGEYHGEMTAATLLPVGLPLSGVQVYENMRAVDYLCTRPEVDSGRIGITGASGGGNQSMYAGAWDTRIKAAVPVCSVGNYQAYLGAACCMCEVVPGALKFTEECGVLGLTAPRALMVVNATRDAAQFSVDAANRSLAGVSPIYHLSVRPTYLRHDTFESGHDYSAPMREAMYGWMTLHLKGEGDGSPVHEPDIKTEDPETLRCFPGDTRPNDWMTLPRFAAAEAKKILELKKSPTSPAAWHVERTKRCTALAERVLGGIPKGPDLQARAEKTEDGYLLHFHPETGISLTAKVVPGASKSAHDALAILLDLDGSQSEAVRSFSAELRTAGKTVVTLDLRTTGSHARKGDAVGNAPDHNTAEWALWIGRPLLGQWTVDVMRLIDALERTEHHLPQDIAIVGIGPAGAVAISAAALDPRLTRVATVGMLASYVTDKPYRGQRLGIMAPGILREVGDVAHLAALIAPRRLIVAGGVAGGGDTLDIEVLRTSYAPAIQVWKLLGAHNLEVTATTDAATVVRALQY